MVSKKQIALRLGGLTFGLVIYLIGASIIAFREFLELLVDLAGTGEVTFVGPLSPLYYKFIPLCIYTGIYIGVFLALRLRSQITFRIAALITAIGVFWPICFNYGSIWHTASYFELMATFAVLMGIYLGAFFVIWIICKIRFDDDW